MSNRIQAEEHFARIASEWQDFVGRRVKEDFHLMHRLTQSGTPNQILVAYTDFWQKAAEDYGEEIATMSKLMTEVATKMATTMHAATHEASETRLCDPREFVAVD